jgi:hypothetical protein
MAYGDFDLRRALTDFGLTSNEGVDLFAGVPPVEPSAYLTDWLAEFAPVALGIGSERGRGEAIIFPILAEAKRHCRDPVTVASGVTFDVDRGRGLTGVCDYLITRSRNLYFVRGPVFAAVEAKREDINGGLGQCVAEMVAVRVFNEREGTPLPAVHGCVTSGNLWRFLKLEGDTLFVDRDERHLRDLPMVLGILVHIVGG